MGKNHKGCRSQSDGVLQGKDSRDDGWNHGGVLSSTLHVPSSTDFSVALSRLLNCFLILRLSLEP